MFDTGGAHVDSARQLIEVRRAVPGDTPDDIWIARLLAEGGDVAQAISVLTHAPFYGRKNHISHSALAVWIACEYGQPGLAPLPGDTDLAGHIAQLRLAAINNDIDSGQWHMQHILPTVDHDCLGKPRTLGNVPCPALDVTLGEWLDDAYEAWGEKISWLAPGNRKGLINMSNRLQRPICCHPGTAELDLIRVLESGDLVAACRIYKDRARKSHHPRISRRPFRLAKSCCSTASSMLR